MTETFWLALAAKMLTTGVLVVVVSILVERAGPFIGAMVATLPVSAGPAYIFLSLDHDAAFVARSALSSLAINAAVAPFIAVYSLLAQRGGVAVSLGAAIAVWLIFAMAVFGIPWTLPAALAVNAVTFAVAFFVTRRYWNVTAQNRAGSRWWDVPVRAALVMSVVATVVLTARLIGPRVAGIAALVPVVLTSVVVILHPRQGGQTAAAVLVNGLPGLIGFTLALVCLHLTAMPLGLPLAIALWFGISVAWNLMLIAWRHRGMLRLRR
jgi:hypothetical protein